MSRFASAVLRSVVACCLATSLTSCGGRSQSALPPSPGAAREYTGALADATFKIAIPSSSSASAKRRPSYVSSATKSLKFQINTATALTAGQVTSYNTLPWSTFDTGNLPTATCPTAGSVFTCTVTLKLPPGSDNITFTAYDNTGGTGNILSQQVQTFTVVAATANAFSIVLDANITTPNGSMTVNGSGSCQNGPVGSVFGSVGTTPVSFGIAYTDAQNKTIVAPGLPKLQIQDNTATWQSVTGTINGTGGTVAFTVTQNPPSFILTPSNSSTTNAAVNVRAIQADSNTSPDGLSFTKSKTFSFSTGTAPPAHNFLGAVEQIGVGSGQVDFFNITLGGSGGPDSFAAFSPATLAVTNSTNEAKPDVDNPLSLGWDSTGDLLVGNANNGGHNNGNMACVPVGAIATGANTSTTVSANVTSPVALAYDGRDGSVALADNPVGVAGQVKMSEYLLNGNYTAAPGTGAGTRNLVADGLGNNFVVAVPALAPGTYASALTDGGEVDPAHGGPKTSKIALYSPTGVETDITDAATFSIDNPAGLAWDNNSSQLVISNNSIWHTLVSFYTVSPVAKVKVINTGRRNLLAAASPDGHVAIAMYSSVGSGASLIQVFDNTAARNPVGGVIPYNSTSDAGTCANYIYGDSPGGAVQAMTWLSNTKLLVAVSSITTGTPTARNGLYIYDISSLAVPAGFNDETCAAYAGAPAQTGFVHLAKKPFGVAYKP